MVKLGVFHNPRMPMRSKWGVELMEAHYKGNQVLRDYIPGVRPVLQVGSPSCQPAASHIIDLPLHYPPHLHCFHILQTSLRRALLIHAMAGNGSMAHTVDDDVFGDTGHDILREPGGLCLSETVA